MKLKMVKLKTSHAAIVRGGFVWGTFFTFQGVERILERSGAEAAAEGISLLDLALFGRDYYEIWEHHHQAEEIIRMRLKECGDDW